MRPVDARVALICCVACFAGFHPALGGGNGTSSKRFYAGEVLMAEVMSINSFFLPRIANIPKYGKPADFGSDTGYALVVVKLDKGRSISSLDYVLSDGSAEYPCLAISDVESVFDVNDWLKKGGRSGAKYAMIFKVKLPSAGDPKYVLKFALIPGMRRDPDLVFVNVKDKRFTRIGDVPDKGMLKVDSREPKSKPRPKSERAESIGKSSSTKASPAKKGSSKRGGGDKKEKADAKAKEWENMLRKSLNK